MKRQRKKSWHTPGNLLINALLALCLLAVMAPRTAHAWGSLRSSLGDYSTHGAIDLVAYDRLTEELEAEALANFPGKIAVFNNDFVAINYDTSQSTTSTGPDYEPAGGTGPNVPFSWHYGSGNTAATQYYNSLKTELAAKSGSAARTAAWLAHFVADQYVPYHNLGVRYTGQTSATLNSAAYDDRPDDFIAAATAATNGNYDWYDPSYWDSYISTNNSTHIQWERSISSPSSASSQYDFKWSNSRGINDFVTEVQASTIARFDSVVADGATAVSDAARGVYTVWRSALSAFAVKLNVTNSDSGDTFTVSAVVTNHDKLYAANTVQAEIILPEGLSISDSATKLVNTSGVLAAKAVSTPVEWEVSGSASGCAEIRVKVTGQIDGDRPEAAAVATGAVEATVQSPPSVAITSPSSGDIITETKVTVSGDLSENSRAWIEVNGTDKIWISEGYDSGNTFSKEVSLKQGANTIVVKAVNQCMKEASSSISVTGNFSENAIKVVMSWNTSGTDVDLHMTDSNGGAECAYYNKTPNWGDSSTTTDDPQLDIDNTSGYGPETIIIPNPQPGSYTVRVHYYSDHDWENAIPSFVTIKVYEYGVHKGTFTQTLSDTGDTWEGVYTFVITPATQAAARFALTTSVSDYTVTESRISTNARAVHPAINSSQIVWTDLRNSSTQKQIYRYDLGTAQESRVSSTDLTVQPNLQGESGADISDSMIVWDDGRPIAAVPYYESALYGYTISSSTEARIMSSDTVGTSRIAVSGSKMVWEDTRNGTSELGNSDIYLRDLSSGTETRITTNSYNQVAPDISGNRIVWTDTRHGGYTIYMYDLSTSTEEQIARASTGSRNPPAIDDHLIVWEDGRNGNGDIYMYDTETREESRLTTNTSEQTSPDVSGHKVVWVDYRNGNPDIYMLDESTGVEVPICTNSADQLEPRISGNRVVWTDYRNGTPDIYMAEISTGSTVTPATPLIQANGQRGTVTASASSPVAITVSLAPGGSAGTTADWWLVANTPFGWFSYLTSPLGWASGFSLTAQAALSTLASYEALNMQLPAGTYTFYFGVDLQANGTLDMGNLLYDSVTVQVSP